MDDDHNLYKRGKTWWFRATVGGREVRESLRTTSGTVARKARNARLAELRDQAEVRGGLTRFFVTAAVEFCDFLETAGSLGWTGETTTRYACSMRAIARAMVEISDDNDLDINVFRVDEFDVTTIADLVARRAETVGISTINRDLTALNHFLIFCKNHKWIDANPLESFEKQGMAEKLPPIRLPTDEAIGRMIDRGPETFGCLVRFIDREGTRATETARLPWDDIDVDPEC